jgi:hypothetical protein
MEHNSTISTFNKKNKQTKLNKMVKQYNRKVKHHLNMDITILINLTRPITVNLSLQFINVLYVIMFGQSISC